MASKTALPVELTDAELLTAAEGSANILTALRARIKELRDSGQHIYAHELQNDYNRRVREWERRINIIEENARKGEN